MRLRNKKTGGIWDIPKMRHPTMQEDDISFFAYGKDEGHLFSYKSLAELNEEWEDYEPKEPLIEYDGARDAVRSWASTLEIHEVRCKKTVKGVDVITFEAFRLGSAPRIEFASWSLDADVTDGAIYTIAELCGEEEEE